MGPAKIHTLTSTPQGILLVFYTDGGCWSFRVLSSGGAVFWEQKLYYTAEAAETGGREWAGEWKRIKVNHRSAYHCYTSLCGDSKLPLYGSLAPERNKFRILLEGGKFYPISSHPLFR